MVEELRSTMFFPEALNGGNLVRCWFEQILQIVVRWRTRFGCGSYEGELGTMRKIELLESLVHFENKEYHLLESMLYKLGLLRNISTNFV